jgi:hypothetical protein
MKKFLLLFAFTGALVAAKAQPPAGNAKPGDTYGAKIAHPSNAIAISEMVGEISDTTAMHGVVKAKVLDVCPKKGCWLKLAVNDSTTAFVKMKDYGFFLPTAIKGKTVVIEGELKKKVTSVDELRHYAKDAKKTDAEIAAITEPKEELRVTASGITVVQ